MPASWRRIFTRHIPGNPQIVLKTMLGGSGIQAAGYMTNVTPQDGLSLGTFLDSLPLGKVLGGHGEFDPVKLKWIGRIVSTATVSVVWHTSPVQTIEEAKKREILMAGTVASNTSNFIPAALNDLIGTKIKVIMGFRGSPDQALAMLRGEVSSIGGMSWEAIQTNHQEWLTEKKIRIFYAQGAQRIKDLPNDPGLLDFATDERSRRILGLLGSGPDMGRTLVAEPNIPPDRARSVAQGVHGHHAGSGIHRRHGQAQAQCRAADRRRGAKARRRHRRDAEGTRRTSQALYRAIVSRIFRTEK